MASSMKIFLIFSVVSLVQLQFCAGQNAVNGVYWFPDSGFAASDIDSSLFTHIFCAFADLDPQTKQVTISSTNNASFYQFSRTVQLKNPSVKTLLSIGGGSSNKTVFSQMASQPSLRKSFIDSSIKLARSYGFYGLDLDWEYPQTSSDMTNLGTLLIEWRTAVTTEAQSSGKSALLLTAAFYYAASVNGLNYPVNSIDKSLDWVNAMAYDFYGPSWYGYTNSHSMLYDSTSQVSGSYGINSWIRAGLGAKKLALGIPFYGYAWRLANANNHGMLAPSTGPAAPYAWRLANANNHGMLAPSTGPAAPDSGAMGYNQIKNFIATNSGTVVVYNSTIVTNYCYSGTTWIGYDDTQSVAAKVSYAKQKGLLGYFAWHVGVDSNWALSKQAKQSWGLGDREAAYGLSKEF